MLYFSCICSLLEEVHNAKGLADKITFLQKGFTKMRENTLFNVQQNYDSFYQGIRLIVPKMDHGRKSYNMKENKIARAIIKMLNLPDGPDKRNLLNYYRIQSSTVKLDFADIVHSTLKKYISTKQTMITVPELNDCLDSIANRDAQKGIDDIMLQMFRKLTTQESKWVIRIMLKELKLDIDNNKILNVFHPDAAEYYTSNTNLQKVCEILWNPSVKLNELGITLFEPFNPMLSKRSDAKTFTKDFPDKKLFFIEKKFDGERFQMHMENGNFQYFSRNGFNYSEKFGNSYSSGIMTPKLKEVFHSNVKRLILDGEMMLWNTKTKKFGSKGMTFDVKKLNNSGYYQPCFCVFDVLLLNDEVLTNKHLSSRLKCLRKVFQKSIEGTIVISDYEESTSREGIIRALNKTMDLEEEGIVVKDPTSIYKYKDRKSGWYKIKLEYFEEGVTDLDLILMGGTYKTNSHEINSFLVGVYTSSNDNILCLGKVASGVNFEEMQIINKKLKEKGYPYNEFPVKTKGKLVFGREVPDIWVEPENSFIFTVRATELIRSNNDAFRTPYTLRFPRILKIRDDKSYKECLSINELLELCQQNKAVIKLNKRYLELADIQSVKRQKKIKKLEVDIEAMKRKNNCLEGIKFHVMNGTEEFLVDKIEMMITSCGGSFTLSLEQNVNIVLIGTVTQSVKEILNKEHTFDIIYIEWLQRVSTANSLKKYRQDEVLSIGTSYYNCLADDVDMFGDSYTEEVNEESLKNRLDFMAEREYSTNLNESIHFKSDLPLFNKYLAYFDRHHIINDFTSELIYDSFLDEIEFSYRKGTIVDIMGPEVNLIVMGSSNETRKLMIEEFAETVNCRTFQVVDKACLYEEEEL